MSIVANECRSQVKKNDACRHKIQRVNDYQPRERIRTVIEE